VLERILDVVTVLCIGGAVFGAELPNSIRDVLVVTSLLLFIAAAAIGLLAAISTRLSSVLACTSATSPHRLFRFVASQLAELVQALTISRSPMQWTFAIVAGVIGWAFFSTAMIACVAASSAPAPVTGGLLLTVLTNLGGLVPSSPASIGIYHVLAVLALSISATSKDVALAVAVVSHALQLLLGVAGFSRVQGLLRARSNRLVAPVDES
jgi:uncharacterized membrane protein YbhN (UPF0104 family)